MRPAFKKPGSREQAKWRRDEQDLIDAIDSAPKFDLTKVLGPAGPARNAEALLSFLDKNTRMHVLRSRVEIYAALGDVYYAWCVFGGQDEPTAKRFYQQLIKRMKDRGAGGDGEGVARTYGGDLLKLMLREVIRYPDEGGKRAFSKVSRDAAALTYASQLGIEPADFVDQLERGGGLTAWASAGRAANPKTPRAKGSPKSATSKVDSDPYQPAPPPPAPPRHLQGQPTEILIRISGKKVQTPMRKGRYLYMVKFDPEKTVHMVTMGSFLQVGELSPAQRKAFRSFTRIGGDGGTVK